MKPGDDLIRSYIRTNRARFTAEAIRGELVAAGHDPAHVDEVLGEEWPPASPVVVTAAEPSGRALTFTAWILFIACGAAGPYLAFALPWFVPTDGLIRAVFLGTYAIAYLGIGYLIVRLIGWAGYRVNSSGTASRVIGALLILTFAGLMCGTVLGARAISSVFEPHPRPGVVELQIDAPWSFDESGPAVCVVFRDGFNVNAFDLGPLNERTVAASIGTHGNRSGPPWASGTYRAVELAITLFADPGSENTRMYVRPGNATVELDAPSDGHSGSLTFEGLVPEGGFSDPPISGTISWTCE